MTKPQTRAEVANACVETMDTEFFRVLGEPVRIEILKQLVLKGRSDIATIAEAMPQDRSVIARHLQLMERLGLLRSQSEGRHVFYEVDGPAILTRVEELSALIQNMCRFCCPPGSR